MVKEKGKKVGCHHKVEDTVMETTDYSATQYSRAAVRIRMKFSDLRSNFNDLRLEFNDLRSEFNDLRSKFSDLRMKQ